MLTGSRVETFGAIIISVAFVLGRVLIEVLGFYGKIVVPDSGLLHDLVTADNGFMGVILTYWVGSSRGSKVKDEQLASARTMLANSVPIASTAEVVK